MSTVEEAEKAVDMFHHCDMNGLLLTVNEAAPRGARPEMPARAFHPTFRIYAGNLPRDVHNARLEQVFAEHGKVTSARVIFAPLDGQSLDGRAIRVNVAEEMQRRGSF